MRDDFRLARDLLSSRAMRSALPLLVLPVVAAGSASGACSVTPCSKTMPGSVYCEDAGAGESPSGPMVAVAKSSPVLSYGRRIAVPLASDRLGDVVTSDRDLFVAPSPPDRICWFTDATVDCAPGVGQPVATWIAAAPEGAPRVLAPVPDTADFVVAYVAGDGSSSALARVPAGGAPSAPFAYLTGAVDGVVVAGGDVFAKAQLTVTRTFFDRSPPERVATLDDACSLYASGVAVYCANGSRFTRLAPGDASPSANLASPGQLRPGTGILIRVDGDHVSEVDVDGTPKRVLWQRPPGFDDEQIVDAAADGGRLVVALAHDPCSFVGKDKESQRVCDGSRGRLDVTSASY